MATILEEIVAAKKGEVEEQKRRVSQAELERTGEGYESAA